jgi:hypothetical protein
MSPSCSPAKKAKTKIEDPAQSERFIETARELGEDESSTRFENAFANLVPTRKVEKHQTNPATC